MPTIVFKPAKCAFVKSDVFGEVFTEAPISLNYAYAEGGKIVVHKSKTTNEKVWTDLEKLTDVPVVIHFNDSDEELLEKTDDNWSPVALNQEIVMASAGPVLKVHGDRGKKFSDIKVFIDIALTKASEHIPNFIFTSQGQWLIENILTSKAAIVALRADGSFKIFNENCGYDFKGMWVFDSFLAEMQENRRQVFTEEDWNLFRD